jgi:hypothetical protein
VEVFDPASTRVQLLRINYVSFHYTVRTAERDPFERFVCYLRTRCHGNACSPKTVVQQRSILRCQGNVLSEAPPSRRSYSGFQASCDNTFSLHAALRKIQLHYEPEPDEVIGFFQSQRQSDVFYVGRPRLSRRLFAGGVPWRCALNT